MSLSEDLGVASYAACLVVSPGLPYAFDSRYSGDVDARRSLRNASRSGFFMFFMASIRSLEVGLNHPSHEQPRHSVVL